MKYIVRCKKTLYYDWSIDKFGNNRNVLKNSTNTVDLFNNRVVLVAKRDQLAAAEDIDDGKLKLSILNGKSYKVDFSLIHQYFDLIYLNDVCFESKQKLLKYINKRERRS